MLTNKFIKLKLTPTNVKIFYEYQFLSKQIQLSFFLKSSTKGLEYHVTNYVLGLEPLNPIA